MPENKVIHRSLLVERAEINEETRELTLSCASAIPVERWDGYEVLEISDTAIRWDRLRNAAPHLLEHDPSKQIGVIEKAWIEDGKLRVTVRYSKSALGEEIYQDVLDGIRKNASIGYLIHGMREEVKNGVTTNYITDWEPTEVSIVPVPADNTVGVGRSAVDNPKREMSEPITTTQEPPAPPATVKPISEAEARNLRNAEMNRVREIYAIGKTHNLADDKIDAFIKDGIELSEVRSFALSELEKRHKNGPTVTVEYEPNPNTRGGKGSVGAEFVASEGFKRAVGGRGQGQRVASLDIKDCTMLGARGKASLNHRAGFTSADLSAINIAPQQNLVTLGVQRLTIMDLLAGGNTGAAAIPYPRENGFGTINGVPVEAGAFPRALTVGERGVKPNWDPDLTTESANVKKVAITTKVPDEFMSDFPGMQSYIDERLPYMVDLETEFQLLYGDGQGNNLKGIFATQGVQTRAIDASSETKVAESLKKGLTDIGVGSQFEPTAYAFHPYDWETASLLKDGAGRFLAGGPFYIPYGNGVFVEQYTFWGKPVVITTSVAYGRPVAGSWKLGAQYFIREGMRLETTNSNEDDFKRNLIAIRAEHRLALATYRPVAFLEFTGFPARA